MWRKIDNDCSQNGVPFGVLKCSKIMVIDAEISEDIKSRLNYTF
jgi:hypothetical protein